MSDTPETDDQPIIYPLNELQCQVLCVDLEFARKLERERDEAQHEIEGWRNKWHCAVEMAATAQVERDEARELAQQMSDSNQVLLADVKYYRGEFERIRRSHE